MIESEASYRAALGVSRTVTSALANPTSTAAASRRRVEVVLGGNCNVDFLKPGLEAVLWADGMLPVVRSTGYDDWIGAAIDGATPGDAWVIWLSSAGWSRHGQARPDPPLAAMASAVRAIRRQGAAVIVVLPEPEPSETDPFSPFAAWRRALVAQLRTELAEHAVLIDPTALLMRAPSSEWADARYWITAKCPWSPDHVTRLAALCGHTLARLWRPRVRAVVVDLDDTLWGGLAGEAGVDGVVLDPMGEGGPFLALQRFLKDLSDTGVVLAVASKNNPEDAIAVFAQRAEMLLRRDDFVFFEVNWASKADAIRRIAGGLNIGLDAVCFLDNSPHERDEVRHLLPEVIVPELPEAPGEWVSFLHDSRLFLKPVVREDDVLRVSAYRADAGRRRQEETAIDRDDYLRGLQMRLVARRLQPQTLPRATELVQKTNQFNLTNRRHSERQMLELVERPGSYAYSFDLSDTFGESGTIGVLLAVPVPGGAGLEVDTLVMSCRVINRTVEVAMFAHLAEWARRHEIGVLRGRYVPSARNGLVADFFPSVGLTAVAEPETGGPAGQVFEGGGDRLPAHFVAVSERPGETA